MKKLLLILVLIIFVLISKGQSCIYSTTNGGFEQPSGCGFCLANESNVPEWNTTASDNKIEIWPNGYQGVPAYQGNQFAELNANEVSTLYIDICTPCATTVQWSFAHRGRLGTDVMAMKVGPPNGPYVQQGTYSDGNSHWGTYSGTYHVPSGQTVTRFLFQSISSAGGNATYGNFLDAVSFSSTSPVSSNSKTICEGQNATLTASGSSSYHWSTGATTHQITVSPSITTSYTVTGTTSGCSTTSVSTVTVRNTPNVSVNSTTICAGQTATLTENGGTSYHWSTGQTAQSIHVSPNTTTSYTVTGTSNQNCSASAIATVTVRPSPSISVNSATICYGDTATLTETGGNNYVWSGGETTNAINVSPAVTTSYTVTETGSNNCTAAAIATVTVNPLPVLSVNSDTICDGESTVLTVTGAYTYLWPDGQNTNSIVVSPSNTTSYDITGISSSNCISYTSTNVVVNPKPVVSINDVTLCSGETAVIDAEGADLFLWSTGETTSTITLSPQSSVTINVIGTTLLGCSDTAMSTVTVNPIPIVSVNSETICEGESSTLSASGADSYTWSTGAITDSIVVSPSLPISYTVIGTSLGCPDTAVAQVIVHPVPVANFTTENVCAGNETPVNDLSNIASGSILSKVWAMGDGSLLANGSLASYLYNSPGIFNVSLVTISDFGCIDSVIKTTYVYPNPTVNFTATQTEACGSLCTTFHNLASITNGGTIVQWLWDFGDNHSGSSNDNLIYCYKNESLTNVNSYNVQLTAVSDNGCSTTFSRDHYITVYPQPVADFSLSSAEETIINPEFSITNLSSGASMWSWDFGDGQSNYSENPEPHNYDVGTYTIQLVVSNHYNCRDTAYKKVKVNPEFAFYIPNAFTPDNDGINDTFTGKGVFINEFEMAIFDRWGNLVYESDNIEKPWDGKVNNSNEVAQRDVYIYKIVVTDFRLQKHSYTGTVTLVR